MTPVNSKNKKNNKLVYLVWKLFTEWLLLSSINSEKINANSSIELSPFNQSLYFL